MINIQWFTGFVCFILSAIAQTNTTAAPAQYLDHEKLQAKINLFLSQYAKSVHSGEFKVKTGSIDPRLRLHNCTLPVEFFINQQQKIAGSLTVGVRCKGKLPWLIYVPSRITLFKQVLAARYLIKRKTTISAADLILIKREITGLDLAYYENKAQVSGHVAKRMIKPGEIIRPALITLPKLVERDELVTLIAETQGISVRMSGRALNSGARGKQIKVRNLSSKRIIEGVIVGKGLVKINL